MYSMCLTVLSQIPDFWMYDTVHGKHDTKTPEPKRSRQSTCPMSQQPRQLLVTVYTYKHQTLLEKHRIEGR